MSDQSTVKEPETYEELEKLRKFGKDIKLPPTGRMVKLRKLDLGKLLQDGKVPDTLTPLAIRSIYSEISDEKATEFFDGLYISDPMDVKQALAHLEAINYVVGHSLYEPKLLPELTIGEKRWIFRLVLLPAEILATFRNEEDPDVAGMDEGNEVREAA
jgi:hypothetical protein